MKRQIYLMGIAVLLVGLGVCGGLEMWARNWEERWKDFVTRWEAKGESFGVTENLPDAMGDQDEFAAHPWIHRIADGEPEVIERVRVMSPKTLVGYDEWEAGWSPHDVRLPMTVEFANLVHRHGAEFKFELDAFADAVQRQGSRLVSADGNHDFGMESWVNQLASIRRLCDALSHAAITLDDPVLFSRMIELQMRAGRTLRASNTGLGIILGCGFEKSACEALQSLPKPVVWPMDERRKWLAVLGCRSRPVADEYAASMRVLRGQWLSMIDKVERVDVGRVVMQRVPRFGAFRRVYYARTRLDCCVAMQEMVLSSRGELMESIDPAKVNRFEAYVADRLTEESDKQEGLGLATMMFLHRGIYGQLVSFEGERAAVREELVDSITK